MIVDHLRALAVFARTVESGSFRGAAKMLGLSPSVVSHHVAQLETALGVVLLHRSTRRISLTDQGQRLFEAARTMLGAAERGLNGIALDSDNPSGQLNIAAPAAFASEPWIDDFAAFAAAFPRVVLTLSFSDAPIDLLGNRIDVAIRAGSLKDSSLRTKRVAVLPRKLVALAAYAAARPAPDRPEDLLSWEWIRLKSRPPSAGFIGPDGKKVEIAFSSRVIVDQAQAMLELARRGLGLCMVPSAMVDADLRAGRLVEVLKGWRLDAPNVYAVWPANAPRSGLGMRFVAFLEERRSTVS